MATPIVEVTTFEEDDFLGQQFYIEHTIFFSSKNELQLFCYWHGKLSKCDHPLKWWAGHEYQFLNVAFLAHQVLGIVGFQIKTK
jgi:hypothetical protein